MESINEIKRDVLSAVLAAGKRIDSRGMYDYRKIVVQPGILQNAEGSAMASIGKSQVMVGVKFDIAKPFLDRPKEGVLSTSADLLPLASHLFETGPPSEDAIELARVVDRGIRSSNTIDLESFYLEEEKVLALYVDIYVLDHDGNLIDCSSLAAMSALLSSRMPKIENGSIVRGEYSGKLPLKEHVVTCTFGKIGERMFLDPSLDEEKGMDCRLTLATTSTHLCAAQKGGWGTYSERDITELLDISTEKGKELRAML
ncbi:TPA: exosome complex protein Rrp42 [Candidatus Micrarchaeota archaeon]|nr:exosome complex protein Rrp42 [Candidatus Micrarchaeota archaeon]HIH31021.1 exosome complex protein Rrp42 [Candidatus Micrarchaeota archaeon]